MQPEGLGAAADAPAGRIERDTAAAKTLITPALLAELGRWLHEYENAITWNSTCLSCPAVLDSAAEEMFRREAAEAKLAAIRGLCRDDQDDPCWPRIVEGIRAVIDGGETEFAAEVGGPSAADREMVARATGGGIRSCELQPRFSDEDEPCP